MISCLRWFEFVQIQPNRSTTNETYTVTVTQKQFGWNEDEQRQSIFLALSVVFVNKRSSSKNTCWCEVIWTYMNMLQQLGCSWNDCFNRKLDHGFGVALSNDGRVSTPVRSVFGCCVWTCLKNNLCVFFGVWMKFRQECKYSTVVIYSYLRSSLFHIHW